MKTFLILFVTVCVALAAIKASAATCESLSDLKLENTTITSARVVSAGMFAPPGSTTQQSGGLTAYSKLPAFCRVQGVVKPSSDSHVEFEVWLPASDWNGKYQGTGNGGFAGYINFADLAQAVSSGYASSSTDTGHKAGGMKAEWALGHPEKIVDFGYRAIHETAKNSKAIIRAFYGSNPKQSYFSNCSTGGRQGLIEAQRYPEDYDGIIAGSPSAFWSHIAASLAWNMQATEADPASYIPGSKLPAIEAGALSACDTLDGVKDGVIDDPTKCPFDPSSLLCSGPETDSCLTQPQVTALKKIYAGPRDSRGEQIYPGRMQGGETGDGGWLLLTGSSPATSVQYSFGHQAYRYLVFQNPAWDYRAFDFDSDVKLTDDRIGDSINAVDPNLKAFKDRGGKLILYHGWSDSVNPPMGTVNYYQSIASKMGKREADDFVRLYMVPGMLHCAGGPGPNSFETQPSAQADLEHSMSIAVERWVEKGTAPGKIIATKYKVDGNPASGVVRTRPLCPYPQVARYKGSGSMDEASNFNCVESQ
jgi:hypothetical protein